MLDTLARGGDPYASQPALTPQAPTTPMAPAGRNALTPEQIGALNDMLENLQRTGVQQELPPSLFPQARGGAPATPPAAGR